MIAVLLSGILLLYPEVRWDYPMQVIPEGWISENWGYNPLYWTTLNIWADEPGEYVEGHLYSGADSILIPPNCDSIVLEVDQMVLDMDKEGWGICYAEINYRYYSGWGEAWKEFGPYLEESPSLCISAPPIQWQYLSVSIPVTHREHLSLDFHGVASVDGGGSGSANVLWGLKYLTLTLWCDGTPIVYDTWAHLKYELGSEGTMQ